MGTGFGPSTKRVYHEDEGQMEFLRGVAGRLRGARAVAGLTQWELADAAGVSRSTLAKVEVVMVRPKAEFLAAVARVLGVAVDDLLPVERKE